MSKICSYCYQPTRSYDIKTMPCIEHTTSPYGHKHVSLVEKTVIVCDDAVCKHNHKVDHLYAIQKYKKNRLWEYNLLLEI